MKTPNKAKRELSDEEWEAVEHLRTSKAIDKEMAKRRNQGDRFVQVNTKILAKQSADFTNVKEYQLMNYFYDRMGRSNALMVSNKKMAALLNCSTRTVITITKMLEEKQYIRIVKVGTSNAYVVNADVAWKTGRDGKHGAIFNATVVVDWDEQLKEHVDRWTGRLQPVPKEFLEQLEKDKGVDKLTALRKQLEDYDLIEVKANNPDTKSERCDDTDDMFEADNFLKND
jgi:DNA-binding Lrp family transcriptional regulator